MNPLLNHPVFSHLPYKLLKNPTLEEIRPFLLKRARTMKLFKYGALISAFLQFLTLIDLSRIKMFEIRVPLSIGSIESYFMFFALLFGAYLFHKSQKQCLMSDEEIIQAINVKAP